MTLALRSRVEIMSQTPRILVVEDQYFVAIDSELNLRNAGYEVVELATTAKEVTDRASQSEV